MAPEHVGYTATLATAKRVPNADLTACHGTPAQLKANATLFTPENLAAMFPRAEREGIANLTFGSLYQPHRHLMRPGDLRAAGLTFNESAMRHLASPCWLHLRTEHVRRATTALRDGNYVAAHMRLLDHSSGTLGGTVARWSAALFERLADHNHTPGTAVFVASGVPGGVCAHKRTDTRLVGTFACIDGEHNTIRGLWPSSAEMRDISMVTAARLGLIATFNEMVPQDLAREANFATQRNGSAVRSHWSSSFANVMLSAWTAEHAPEKECHKEVL